VREIDRDLEYEDFCDKGSFHKVAHVLIKGVPRRSRRDRYDDNDQYDEI